MCAYMYIIYIYIYIYIHIYMYVYMYTYFNIHLHIYIYMYSRVVLYIYIYYICTCINAYMHLCMCMSDAHTLISQMHTASHVRCRQLDTCHTIRHMIRCVTSTPAKHSRAARRHSVTLAFTEMVWKEHS